MAEDGTDYMLVRVREHTPVSEPPSVPGYPYLPGGDGVHLKDEIHRSEITESQDVYEGKVGSEKDYSPFVEEGTGLFGPKHAKYLILPHKPGGWLAWPGEDGFMHFAQAVWHPGSPGAHMLMKGGYDTETATRDWRARGDQILSEGMRA